MKSVCFCFAVLLGTFAVSAEDPANLLGDESFADLTKAGTNSEPIIAPIRKLLENTKLDGKTRETLEILEQNPNLLASQQVLNGVEEFVSDKSPEAMAVKEHFLKIAQNADNDLTIVSEGLESKEAKAYIQHKEDEAAFMNDFGPGSSFFKEFTKNADSNPAVKEVFGLITSLTSNPEMLASMVSFMEREYGDTLRQKQTPEEMVLHIQKHFGEIVPIFKVFAAINSTTPQTPELKQLLEIIKEPLTKDPARNQLLLKHYIEGAKELIKGSQDETFDFLLNETPAEEVVQKIRAAGLVPTLEKFVNDAINGTPENPQSTRL